MMNITARDLCALLNGTLEGNPEVEVNRPARIEEATEGTISFLANPKYEDHAYTTGASVLLVSMDFQPAQPIKATLIRVGDVYTSVAFLLEKFGAAAAKKPVISPQASVHQTAVIGEGVSIGAFAVVEEGAVVGAHSIIHPQAYIGPKAHIGQSTTLYPGVRILQECQVGDRCIIHSNTVIGSDGFGFVPQPDGTYRKIAHIGNVVIENDVEIGANTAVDRAVMGSTIIRNGVKLDNLIQIAHNVEIGENTVIAALAGISGSTKIGKQVMIGGQVGMAGHITIADGVKVDAQSGIIASVKEPGALMCGSPAIPRPLFFRAYSVFRNLPELVKKIK